MLRAALAGKLDDDKYSWSGRIREANNPMAMFAAKLPLLIERYSAFERRKTKPKAATAPTDTADRVNQSVMNYYLAQIRRKQK